MTRHCLNAVLTRITATSPSTSRGKNRGFSAQPTGFRRACCLHYVASRRARCLCKQTVADLVPHNCGRHITHPALGQDSMPLHTKGYTQFTRQQHRAVYPGAHRSGVLHITANATTWVITGFPDRIPGSSFTSACDTFCSSRTLMEFTRVSPISCALPLSVPVLN